MSARTLGFGEFSSRKRKKTPPITRTTGDGLRRSFGLDQRATVAEIAKCLDALGAQVRDMKRTKE